MCAWSSFHYWRIHPHYWEDRLKRGLALGLNTIQAMEHRHWLISTKVALVLIMFGHQRDCGELAGLALTCVYCKIARMLSAIITAVTGST